MILYNKEARDFLKKGVDILADAVKVTLGPCGSNVVMYKNGIPHITKDGVTVAKSIEDDNYKPGIELIRQVSENTGKEAGDATTSSTVLAQTIVDLVFNQINDSNITGLVSIKRGIDFATKVIVAKLKENSVPVGDKIRDVAYISSNGDEEITSVVTEVMNKVSKNGMISVKPGGSKTYVTYSEGLKWETSYINPNFVTDPVKMEVEYNNCAVLIYDDKLSKVDQILSKLEYCKKNNIPVIIAVKEIEQEALNTLILNKLNGILECCVVKIPGFDHYKEDNILDLKTILKDGTYADKVTITKEAMFIVSDGRQDEKEARIASLKHRLTLTDPDVEDLNTRIANISNSFATIYVSGNSEVEIAEKIDRYDDAICAVRAALDEGIVPGGGNALYDIYRTIDIQDTTNRAFDLGVDCMIEALTAPIKQILSNGEAELPDKSKHIIYKDGEFYSVQSAIDNGVVDPTKAVRLTVENAASIAGAIITTRCVIYKI